VGSLDNSICHRLSGVKAMVLTIGAENTGAGRPERTRGMASRHPQRF
jgi:hypothetical protein